MVHKTYLQFYGNQIFNFRLCQQITVECATFSSQSVDKIAHWVRTLVTPSQEDTYFFWEEKNVQDDSNFIFIFKETSYFAPFTLLLFLNSETIRVASFVGVFLKNIQYIYFAFFRKNTSHCAVQRGFNKKKKRIIAAASRSSGLDQENSVRRKLLYHVWNVHTQYVQQYLLHYLCSYVAVNTGRWHEVQAIISTEFLVYYVHKGFIRNPRPQITLFFAMMKKI